jgi:hypothetical protein
MMAVTIEKRTVKIPSCIIDKSLLQEMGALLESDTLLQGRLSYSLDTKTKDVKSDKIEDFVRADWGSSINKITIETDSNSPRLKININFQRPKTSEFSLSGRDSTWVNGFTSRIEDTFNKHKTSYQMIEHNSLLKICLTLLITTVLVLPVFLWAQHYPLFNSTTALSMTLLSGYGALGILVLVNWLLPHFEYEGALQKRVRKGILLLLFSSGIIPSIILKLIGL